MDKRFYMNSKPQERMARMAGSNPQPGGADNRLCVSRAGDAVLVQVFGLGNMALAPTLQSFVESELRNGFLYFVVDLKSCQGMDSTFMGTFIGLSTTINNRMGWFCLVNVDEENRRLLKMLGVLHLVSIREGEFPDIEGESTTLYPTNDVYARQKQIHKAHVLLVDADPRNKEIFGPYIEAMEQELGGFPTIIPPGEQDDPDTDQAD